MLDTDTPEALTDEHLNAQADPPTVPARGVTDPDRLYVLSGMIDVLRDVTGLYVTQGVDPGRAAVDQVLDQYERLRAALPETLSANAAAELAVWAVQMDSRASLPHLHLTLASVARYIDALLQAPQFAAQHRLITAASDQTNRQLANGSKAQLSLVDGQADEDSIVAGYRGGAYL